MRRLLAVLVVVAVAIAAGAAVGRPVRAEETAAERAAREIADARDRANAAAAAFWDAESEIERLDGENARLQQEVTDLQAEVAGLQAAAQTFAVNRYVNAGHEISPMFVGSGAVADQLRTATLSNVIDATSSDDLDALQAKSDELHAAQTKLAGAQRKQQDKQQRMAELRDAATAEVAHLQQVEAQRLQDEAVRRALAAEQARRAEQAAAREAASSTTVAVPPIAAPPPVATVAELVAPPPTEAPPPVPVAGPPATPSPSPPPPTEAVVPLLPAPPPPPPVVRGDWTCPTGDAAVAFTDTYGAPRSGGRHHEGVDMIGARGTPILAVVAGVALDKQTSLGGNSIWLTGSDGNKYFYAHLDGFAKSGAVDQGDVIGYMGDSGNAQYSVVHLHFEIHPGGGSAINPYPTVRAHC